MTRYLSLSHTHTERAKSKRLTPEISGTCFRADVISFRSQDWIRNQDDSKDTGKPSSFPEFDVSLEKGTCKARTIRPGSNLWPSEALLLKKLQPWFQRKDRFFSFFGILWASACTWETVMGTKEKNYKNTSTRSSKKKQQPQTSLYNRNPSYNWLLGRPASFDWKLCTLRLPVKALLCKVKWFEHWNIVNFLNALRTRR